MKKWTMTLSILVLGGAPEDIPFNISPTSNFTIQAIG